MSRRLRRLLPLPVIAVALVACKKEPAATPPRLAVADAGARATPVDAGTTAARCVTADDCVLSSYRNATDCCGNPCDTVQPHHRDDFATLKAARATACPDGSYSCPAADCNKESFKLPGCTDGACVAVEIPIERPRICQRDADCVISCDRLGECCPQMCGPCEQAYHEDDVAPLADWRAAHCDPNRCDQAKCPKPDSRMVPTCDSGTCRARRMPI